MSVSSRKIWVTFSQYGIHRYPAAPDEVGYLRSEHRHLFRFKVTIDVYHDDREIEFHMFLNWCLEQYDRGMLQLNHQSCEMLAAALLESIASTYPGRAASVEVSEDGECGAILEWSPE